MAVGDSGRVVIEIDPQLKRAFYGTLAEQGLTLKDWFIKEAKRHVEERRQPELFSAESQASVESLNTEDGGVI